MKKIKKILEYLNIVSLVAIILCLNIGTIIVITKEKEYLDFSKWLLYIGIFCFILYIIHKIIYKEKPKLKDILILLLAFIACISYCFAIDKTMALYGSYGRNEGLFSLLTYYSIFLLASTIPKKNQKVIIYTLLFTGIIQIIIGTIQTLRINNVFGYDRSMNWSNNFKFASGTIGNPNFYSTYILMCLMYVYGCLIKSKDKFNIIFNAILTIIFSYGLIIGNTSSCIISFLLVLICTLIRKINKNNILKVVTIFLCTIIVLVFCFNILNKLCNNRIYSTLKNNVTEITTIFQEGITDETGNGRIYIWKETIKKVPRYIYTGIGIDNFSLINDGYYICTKVGKKNQCFDKAHNEYLQILITEGIFALIIYLLFLSYIIYVFCKNKKYNDFHFYGLSLAFISYLIQAFFNISVIPVAPVFYLMMGFIISKKEKEI
jgi:putative inorganic carbon (HCO3(-)) transporter